MFHLAGWYQSIDPGGNYTALNAIIDERLFIDGKQIRVPELNQVAFLTAFVDLTATGANYRLVAPSIGQYGRFYGGMVNGGFTSGINIVNTELSMMPLMLGVDEQLSAQVNSNPAAATKQAVFIAFSDGQTQPLQSNISIQSQGTLTGTVTEGQWSLLNWVPTDDLPPGNYNLVGMSVWGDNNALAARIVLRAAGIWRPGCICYGVNASNLGRDMFRHGALGSWGTFPFTQLPAVEIFATGTVTVANLRVVLDLVHTG